MCKLCRLIGVFLQNRIFFNTVLDHMPAGIAILEGKEFCYSKINSLLAELNGLTVKDHIGRPLAEVIPEAAKNLIPRLKKVWKTNEAAEQYEFATILPKNPYQVKWFRDSFFPINDKAGKIKAIGVIVLDITNQKNSEIELKESHDMLENRVLERTEDLIKSEKTLRKQKKELNDKNIALKELLTHIELERQQLKDDISANVEHLIIPSIEKLRLNGGPKKEADRLLRTMENLTSTFGRKIVNTKVKLTPREIEICNLVKNGSTNKEIADLLNIAIHTVEKHRRVSRNKLGIANKEINLNTYLNSL